MLTLGDHLPLAGQHILLTPPQLAALVLECGQIQNSREIRLQQSCLLPAQSEAHCTQTGLTPTQFLRNPVASLSPLQLVRNDLRVLHHLAQIVPNERIQLIDRNESGRTMLLPIRGHGRQFASANVVVVLRVGVTGAPGATELAMPTADQAAQ